MASEEVVVVVPGAYVFLPFDGSPLLYAIVHTKPHEAWFFTLEGWQASHMAISVPIATRAGRFVPLVAMLHHTQWEARRRLNRRERDRFPELFKQWDRAVVNYFGKDDHEHDTNRIATPPNGHTRQGR